MSRTSAFENTTILSVAPGYGVPGEFGDSPGWDLPALLDDLKASIKAGASFVHLHIGCVRDGGRSKQATLRTLCRDLRPLGVVLEGSTGMIGPSSLADKTAILKAGPWDLASLNMGTMNCGEAVFLHPVPIIREIARRIRAAGARPMPQLFELGMIPTTLQLVHEDLIPDPLLCNLTLNMPGAMPASLRNLMHFRDALPANTMWGFVHHGLQNMGLLAAAATMGATLLRVGFENSAWLRPGVRATRNADLVEQAVALLGKLGKRVATPAQARTILGLPQPRKS
jgi:3-keto-5-aminohexanoate cleavage enzyme